jgi:NADP-dependent 3-hydroxy acid dehydrogenase YdfG
MSGGARRALVTGASAGIGRACADDLHANGWAVTGASRRGTTSGGWAGLVMDVDDDDSVQAGVAGMLAAGGRIDALVACSGWGLAGAVEQCTIGEAKAQLETNFWGCVRVVQQVLPAMRAQGGGRIVLMSSIGGVIGIPFQAFYSASRRTSRLAARWRRRLVAIGRQVARAGGPAGQAAAAVPCLRGRGEEQPGSLTIMKDGRTVMSAADRMETRWTSIRATFSCS